MSDGTITTIGCDIEGMLVDKNGEVVPSCIMFPTKEEPIVMLGYSGKMRLGNTSTADGRKLFEDTYGVAFEQLASRMPKVYTDGVQFEFNSATRECNEQIFNDCLLCVEGAALHAQQHGLTTRYLPIMPVDVKRKQDAGRLACESGCVPDFSVYARCQKVGIPNFAEHPFVMAGAHIHIGHPSIVNNGDNVEYIEAYVKLLDRYVGCLSVMIDRYPKESSMRRRWYGDAGTFRFKPYGVEYRVLSASDFEVLPAWSLFTRMARNLAKRRDLLALLREMKVEDEYVQHAINESDKVAADIIFRSAMKLSDITEIKHPCKTIKMLIDEDNKFIKLADECVGRVNGHTHTVNGIESWAYWVQEGHLNTGSGK